MQKQKLEILTSREMIKNLENAFMVMPLVTRDCVKSLNKLFYNLQIQHYPEDMLKEFTILILRGFSSKDKYLKSLIYAILEEMSTKCSDGILSINSILKDIEDKGSSAHMRNSAFRALFTNLPNNMRYDFEKYIEMALLDDSSRDNAVCIATEYFKDLNIRPKIVKTIEDYHQSFFNRLSINKYSSMLEIRRMAVNNKEISKISQYLTTNTDPITFFEAAKALTRIRQELAAPMIEKAISVLRVYLKSASHESFAAMKLLSKLSIDFSAKVAVANREIEDLIQSPSKTISMLAILTLLKTGTSETVKYLVCKIEPLMQTMSESYKVMAIETMEKLSKDSKSDFVSFLKNALVDRGELNFKRFILKKLSGLLHSEKYHFEIIRFLCSYVEDPEFYQLSMDVLGILGNHLERSKDLIHVYNRLILDNAHVRGCAYQTLFNLEDRFQTIESFKEISDPETVKIRSFLSACTHVKKGPFDIDELGDLKEEVIKYMDSEFFVKNDAAKEEEDSLIKECRSISVSGDNADFDIFVMKKMYVDKVILEFTIENKMNKVLVNSGTLALSITNQESDDEKGTRDISVAISKDDFEGSKFVSKSVEIDDACIGDSFNGVFEYEICFQEEYDDSEKDTMSLVPFEITLLDYTRPVCVSEIPANSRTLELKFKSKPTEAISKIVSVSNMHLSADKDNFELQGLYEKQPIVIRGEALTTKYTTINMEVFCDNENVLEKILSIFD